MPYTEKQRRWAYTADAKRKLTPAELDRFQHGPLEHAKGAAKGATMSKQHPGFAAVQAKIAKEPGVSMNGAGAILAASSRNASAKARKANPRLKKVSGAAKGGYTKGRAVGKGTSNPGSPRNRHY